MSTKIYEARRLPVRRVGEFIEFVDGEMMKPVLRHVRKLMAGVKPEFIDTFLKEQYGIEKKNQAKEPKLENLKRFAAFSAVLAEAKKAAASNEWNGHSMVFDLNCGWSMWTRGGLAYMTPFGPQWLFRSPFKYPEWAEDYSYWNNTDRPEGVSQRAWDARGDMWDKVWDRFRKFNFHIIDLLPPRHIESQTKLEMKLFPDR